MWREASAEFGPALAALGPERTERRAQTLVDASMVYWWLVDHATGIGLASEGLEIANALGRDDLASAAMALLAGFKHQESNFSEARTHFRSALARAGGMRVTPLAYAPHTFYMLGEHREAVDLAQEAVRSFRQANDTPAIILALSHLGLNLAALGRYSEAVRAFDEAQQFGHEREARPLVARAMSMSSAFHLDLFDFGAPKRSPPRRANWPAPRSLARPKSARVGIWSLTSSAVRNSDAPRSSSTSSRSRRGKAIPTNSFGKSAASKRALSWRWAASGIPTLFSRRRPRLLKAGSVGASNMKPSAFGPAAGHCTFSGAPPKPSRISTLD